MNKLSIVICTDRVRIFRLRSLLSSLKTQDLSSSEWELIVVNYGSHALLEKCIDMSWHNNYKIENLSNTNLAEAKLKAIELVQNDYIVFLQDNVILENTYFSTISSLIRERPYVGAFFGNCVPQFDAIDIPVLYLNLLDKFYPSVKHTQISNAYLYSMAPLGLVLKTSLARLYLNNFYLNNQASNEIWHNKYYLEMLDLVLYNYTIDTNFLVAAYPQLNSVALITSDEFTETEIEERFIKRLIGLQVYKFLNQNLWPKGSGKLEYLLTQFLNILQFKKHSFFITKLHRKSFLTAIQIAFELRRLKTKYGT